MVAPMGLPVHHDRDIDFLETYHGSTIGTPRPPWWRYWLPRNLAWEDHWDSQSDMTDI